MPNGSVSNSGPGGTFYSVSSDIKISGALKGSSGTERFFPPIGVLHGWRKPAKRLADDIVLICTSICQLHSH